ncbi:ABC transporter permease [Isoptericola halotolerans]|uniref:Transport permease protein n=1 Tax=Isoptericola halotolerans TaxID=300560 RepID=A0ABX2A671_9MICO|nr:ABC transporter permease [Isoptericola halotolerans]NOV98352.1 ABC-2 type transport system permease protein [Isoptericola halotolerans]
MTTSPSADPAPAPAPARRRIAAQASFETRAILRNGEQLLVTIVVPVLLLVGLVRTSVVDLDTGGVARVDFVTPGILALACVTTAFTSQSIATAFDRRNGVLRLLATTPLGRGGLLAGKILGVLCVEVVQVVVIGAVALSLGWQPSLAGILPALGLVLLGTAAFTALALLLAGTLRAEGVLAVANLVLVLLVVGGGLIMAPSELPGPLSHLAAFLPSGALGEGLRGAFLGTGVPPLSIVVLLAWTAAFGAGAGKLFRWH